MWYNNQRKTRAQRCQSSHYRTDYQKYQPQKFVNPRERLMNNQKRQKLRELLIDRFAKKYNISKNKEIIEGEITKFLQQEKLNDVDLQRLDRRIQKIISENNAQKNLKSTLTRELNYNQQPDLQPEIEQNQKLKSNIQEESIYPTNYCPPIKSKNTAKQRSSTYDKNIRPLSSQTYIRNDKIDLNKNKYKYKIKI